MRSIYYILLKIRIILQKSMALKGYYSLPQSVLHYGIIGCVGAYKTNLNLQEIQ